MGRLPSAWMWAAAAVIVTACGGDPEPREEIPEVWLDQGDGKFVHAERGEAVGAEDLLELGRQYAREGNVEEALAAFTAVHASGARADVKSAALREEARTLAAAGRRVEAHRAYLVYFDRYPGSTLATPTIEEALRNAFTLADEGQSHGVAGIHFYSTPEEGIQAARDLLNRFPREDFSGEYAFRLGEFYYDRGAFETAIGEFESVRREYPRTPWAEASLFRIGLCHRRLFKGIPYDPTHLVEARRRFEKFIEEYPQSRLLEDDGQGGRGARSMLAEVRALQARKDYDVAGYYDDRGRLTAARTMYGAVARDYPDTPVAQEAERDLKALPEPDSITN